MSLSSVGAHEEWMGGTASRAPRRSEPTGFVGRSGRDFGRGIPDRMGRQLFIKAACVDSGGHFAAEVLSYCAKRQRRRIFAIKGAAGVRPIWPKWASRAKNNDAVFTIGVDAAKETWHGRLRIALTGEPGRPVVHFPISETFNAEYFRQIASEEVVTRYREGRPYRVWLLLPGRRNEVFDCLNYSLAARLSVPIDLVRLGARVSEAPAALKAGPIVIKATDPSVPPPPIAARQSAHRSLASRMPR